MSVSVYLSAALFSAAEQAFNQSLARALTEAGYEVILPQEFDHLGDQDRIFELNIGAISRAGLVLAVVDGPDVDSGVAWEMGYAYALGVPVVALRTDLRRRSETIGAAINIMLHRGATLYLEAGPDPVAEAVAAAIKIAPPLELV